MKATTSTKYEQVLQGLAEEWRQIEVLDRGFTELLHDVQNVDRAIYGGLPPTHWFQDWTRAEQILAEIRGYVARTRELVGGKEIMGQPSPPLEMWGAVLRLKDELAGLMETLKTESASEDKRGLELEWESGWMELDAYLAMLQAHARVVQVKLQLRKRLADMGAIGISEATAAKLPDELRTKEGLQAYRQAVEELQEEKQQFTGLVDVLKSLALYFEGPEERAQRKRLE